MAPHCTTARDPTPVILMAPMFSAYDVVPHPVPNNPARTTPMPSAAMPRATIPAVGIGAPARLAHE